MQAKFEALIKNNTGLWILVYEEEKVISNKWVFELKG